MNETEALEIALMRLRVTVRDLEYTTSLVHRDGTTSNRDLLCTIAPQKGDVIVAQIQGKLGVYVPEYP